MERRTSERPPLWILVPRRTICCGAWLMSREMPYFTIRAQVTYLPYNF